MKPFTHFAVFVFSLIAIAQLLRVALGWQIVINGHLIPLWVSVIVSAIAAAIAVMVSREARADGSQVPR